MRATSLVAVAVLCGVLASGCIAVHVESGGSPTPPATSSGPFFRPKSATATQTAAPTPSRPATASAAPSPSADAGPSVPAPDPLANVTTVGVYHTLDQHVLGLEPRTLGGQFHTGLSSTEPTIGVDSKGRLFLGSGTSTAVSSDDGQSFTEIFPNVSGLPTHVTTFDPLLWVDPVTDRLFQLDLAPAPSQAFLSWTDDVGASWGHNPAAWGSPGVDDHPTMVTAKPRFLPTIGYPNILHLCYNEGAYTTCTASHDGGQTFRPKVLLYTIAEPQNCDGPLAISNGQTGHLRAGADGTVYLPTARCFASGNGYPVIAISQDDGLTWTKRQVTTDDAFLADDHDVDVAIDADNHLYASWNSRGRIVLSTSLDGGVTWATPVNITAPGVTATTFNAIAALGPGRVVVAYLGSTVPGGYEGKTPPTGGLAGDVTGEADPPEWAAATWNAYLTIVDGAGSPRPVLLSVTGNPVSDPLARGVCGRSRCHGMNDFIDLSVGPDGRPWASFVDVCTAACVTTPTTHFDDSQGLAVTLLAGPGPTGALTPLRPEP